jgi:hypothetical protein
MPDATSFRVSPQEIEALFEKARKEPGLNDITALLKLADEVKQIEWVQAEASTQLCYGQVAGTAGWVY